MSSFESLAATQRAAPPDPRKHVNYTLGMVLGVDDFTQEFAYLAGRDQLLARELLGYGTVCGLRVTIEPASDQGDGISDPQVRVGPGLAVTPRGQLVGVPAAQCATLRSWLAAHTTEIEARVGRNATTTLPLYLVLCYRDCLTDQVPIPGEPCRSEDEAFAASRVSDDFKLDLRFAPPEQREEEALRDFAQWLNQVPVAAASDSSPVDDVNFSDQADWEQAIRHALIPTSSPPDFLYGAPPPDLRVRAEEACAFLRVAFRLWTTELRPIFLGRGQTCAGDPPDESCLLLADLAVPLANGGLDGEVALDESRRPYLLHLRMIQEWLICGWGSPVPSDLVVAETEFGQEPGAGVSERYSRADHTHGSPALGGDVSGVAGDLLVERLRGIEVVYGDGGPQPGQVLTFVPTGDSPVEAEADGTWQPQDLPEHQGDVTGTHDQTRVERILGAPVVYARNTPNEGQVLKFTRGAWRPGADDSPASLDMKGDVGGPTDANHLDNLQGIPVEAQSPQPQQVLTYVEDGRGKRWIPADSGGPTSLDGDVIGPTAANVISKLQGKPVEAKDPEIGQVLTFLKTEGGEAWVPNDAAASDNAVTHPAGQPAYSIVAAGTASPIDQFVGSYNGLRVEVAGFGRMRVSFNGYVFPDKNFTYIVKAMPVINEDFYQRFERWVPSVAFERFDEGGCILFIGGRDRPMDEGMLNELGLMIEISRYEIVT